jgi:AcrR family transcriptional regulator
VTTAVVPAGVGATHERERDEAHDRYVDAARELAAESGGAAFTVQQVIAAASGSRKAFYRRFDGKDDLLCELFDADCAIGADFLAVLMDEHEDTPDRMHAWVAGFFTLMAAGETAYVATLVREYRRLAEQRPRQLDAAIEPFLLLLDTEIIAAGADTRAARFASAATFQLVLAALHDIVLGRIVDVDAAVNDVWAFCRGGIEGVAR